MNKLFGLSPFKMRRAGSGGFVIKKDESGYTLEYQKMEGKTVGDRHATVISEKLYKALKAEAKANFKKMAVIVGPEDRGLTP